jgi:ATP-dependent helicase/nuclease subunit A
MMNGRVVMAKRRSLSPLPLLKGEQARASEPRRQVRLSASAGTGKTQVLSARVLRLLLSGVSPESILCLTFTKAGAAEMADRIHERLGAWVTMKREALARDLDHLGEDFSPAACESARNLFAKVLDARGSGLRIQTIHGFCQTLLAGFPTEAGLPPGFRAVEGRAEQALASQALAEMVDGFAEQGRLGDLNRLKITAKRLGEQPTRDFLKKCAQHSDVMAAIGPGVDARVRSWLGLHSADVEQIILAGCSDGGFDHQGLLRIASANRAWGTAATGLPNADHIINWLALSAEQRVDGIESLHQIWAKKDNDLRKSSSGQIKQEPDYEALVEAQFAHFGGLIGLRKLANTAQVITDALMTGQNYARSYVDAKRAAGVVDFNDLIRGTVALLNTPGVGQWISFKLDQAVDHILIDEAQDTNLDQWSIVKAIAGEFFAGSGAKDDRVRTIFKVGDFKQAIFGFQGTDPREFERATSEFEALANGSDQEYDRLTLNASFRSSKPVLDVTDRVLAGLGHAAFGLIEAAPPHVSALGGSGSVTLLPPIKSSEADDRDTDETDEHADSETGDAIGDEDDERGWLYPSELVWAGSLARQIKGWIDGGLYLRNQGRVAEPGDIMILVRSRADLARLIVSRLYEENVAVAGIDRLRLTAPIAVQDLLACMRFALQPLDDLTLASLLVSPLVGWDQQRLYDCSFGRKGTLWPHLRATVAEDDLAFLYQLLNTADRLTPFAFLENILTGPAQGRRKLIARLGSEARDPIEELINAALAFEAETSTSLQLFVDWFDQGEVEIKRDPAKPENAVRVMTVHGAKGLQAPIVVLADATSNPDFRKDRDLDWVPEEGVHIPLFRPKKAELVRSLKDSAVIQAQKVDEEHWRLLYVALTRAEEHLFIGGALKPKQVKSGMGEKSWYAQVEQALRSLGADGEGEQLVYRHEDAVREKASHGEVVERFEGALPDWALQHAAAEAMPPRPLAPSALGAEDREASPPPSLEMRALARRGILLHSLFERLPAVPPSDRARLADAWLTHNAGVTQRDERDALIGAALKVIEAPEFEDIFGADALAEVPLAGVVNGHVISGTVDRLIIGAGDVTVVDFKTGRRVPRDAAAVSAHHKAQMGAYAAVLALMFPHHRIRAALLYSHAPALVELSPEILEAFKPGFTPPQEELAHSG